VNSYCLLFTVSIREFALDKTRRCYLSQYGDVDIELCESSSPSSRTTSSSSSASSMTSLNAGSKPASSSSSSSSSSLSAAAAVNKTNLIVNYLPQTLSQDDMTALFSSVAPVDSCKLVRDKTTGRPTYLRVSSRSYSSYTLRPVKKSKPLDIIQ